MAEFRSMTSLVMLLLLFTAESGQNSSVTVRVGHDATLPCHNVIKHQKNCDATTWISSPDTGITLEELISLGKTGSSGIAKAKSNRLKMTANCSLVISTVRREDAGRYNCRQFINSEQQGPDVQVVLSVITVTEDIVNHTVALFCSVSTYGECEHTVKWLYGGYDSNVETTSHTCSAMLTFPTLHPDQKSKFFDSLKCNVTNKKSGEMLLCNAGFQSSCQTTAGKNSTSSAKNDTPTKQVPLWLYILVAAGSAALLAAITFVVVIRRKKSKGNQTQMDKNMVLISNTAATPETNQDTADPEDGVSYASISYTKKSDRTAQVVVNGGDDEGDAVTYSAVKASSSSPADLSDLYASINKHNNKGQ